ncbi:mechanosensitive ion channel family protein [Pantoea sp. Mhis]|uniref:mechanosensitive ion channel family protein n=1 Tax=Pantoea sp. Mhis TaxID=2576759 RepID=UPI00135B426D|nr:mechanosensitive ion channel domain-containing protein [Pantoea sp. Mhis]MXP56115.1 mechanosensitive ion channel family protein [Pantoea sp. Mhis]
MYKCQFFRITIFVIILISCSSTLIQANSFYEFKNTLTNTHPAATLSNMQKILDNFKDQVASATNENQLRELNDMTLELSSNADVFSQLLTAKRHQIDTQLLAIGSKINVNNTFKERYDITQKRKQLIIKRNKLNNQIKQFNYIKNNALVLSSQIVTLRHDRIKNQLEINSGSIFGPNFWSILINYKNLDSEKINYFFYELKQSIILSWETSWRSGTIMWLLVAMIMIAFDYYYSEKFFIWVSIKRIPEGRLRRSFLAASIAITTPIMLVLTLNCIALAFTRHDNISIDIRHFIERLVQLSVYCGLINGLGRAFLFIQRPSWRLLNIPDTLVLTLKPLPVIVAILVFIFQIIEAFNNSMGTSLNATIFSNGITALLISNIILVSSVFINRIRHQTKYQEVISEVNNNPPLICLIQILLTGIALIILIALFIGYITLARFLSYEIIWSSILFGYYYLLSHLIDDACEILFSTQTATSNRIQQSFNIDQRHLQLAATLINALAKMLLICFVTLALVNSTFATSITPIELIQKIIEFWSGNGLESLDIVPAHMVNAIFYLVVQIYILRSIRSWLEKDFLPKTNIDIGMRMSLLTLFSNIGYVLIILLTLLIMGLQWNKLAWIVSALSVGIGFGLQEIVKNFISGLILLTERPVKVGDLVSINGIEGDIRRINVRATEIQLGDKSTVIVPNSHLIAQNVRNATMRNAQGVVTITITFALDIDLIKVRSILLQVYQTNEYIQKTPEPSVLFKDLTPNGIVLSVTGNVINQRQVAVVKSDLLFNILISLRKEGMMLSKSQQTMIIEHWIPSTNSS